MTPHDQELLEKQLRAIDTTRPNGVLMLDITAVFFAGMAVVCFLFAYTDQPPMRLAANDIVAAQQSQPTIPMAR